MRPTYLILLLAVLSSCGSSNEGTRQSIAVLKKAGIKPVKCPSPASLGYAKGDPVPKTRVCADFRDGPEALLNRLESLSEAVYYPTTDFKANNYPVYTGFYTQSWRADEGDGDRMMLLYNPSTGLLSLTSAENR